MPRIKRNSKKLLQRKISWKLANPESVEDMNNAFKNLFGPLIKLMLQGKMNNHLGYSFQ